jgi:hypothetical protein
MRRLSGNAQPVTERGVVAVAEPVNLALAELGEQAQSYARMARAPRTVAANASDCRLFRPGAPSATSSVCLPRSRPSRCTLRWCLPSLRVGEHRSPASAPRM